MIRKMYGTLLALLLVLPAIEQSVKKIQTIAESEVPVAVRRSLVDNFGNISEGTWTVAFHVLSDGAKTVAQPLSYTFRKGNGHDKVEVKFSPEGRVENARGIEKLVSPTP